MAELVEWYRTTSKEQHPAVVAARLHYDVVRIHPFDDGNGRVSRLLMNYHLLRNDFPPVIIKSTDKNNYLAALQRADVGDFDAFAAYIAQQLLWSLDLTARAAKGESVEEVGDWEKEVAIIEKVWRQEEKPLPKSHDIFIERHKDSFWPLLWALDHKIAIIDAFYAQSNRWVEVKIGGSSTRMSFDELNEYIYQLDTNSVEGIESITANCNWEKFLPNLGISNNLFARIEIRFSLYQYHIFFSPGNNSVVEKKYTLPLMPFEKEGIMETIGKNLVEKIKKAKP